MQARNDAAGLTGRSLIQCSPKGQMMTAAQCWSSSALSAQHAAACYPHWADLEANLNDENHRCSSKMIHNWQQNCDTRRWQPAFQQRCDTRWVPLSREHHISPEPQDHRAPLHAARLCRCTRVEWGPTVHAVARQRQRLLICLHVLHCRPGRVVPRCTMLRLHAAATLSVDAVQALTLPLCLAGSGRQATVKGAVCLFHGGTTQQLYQCTSSCWAQFVLW